MNRNKNTFKQEIKIKLMKIVRHEYMTQLSAFQKIKLSN